MWRPWTWPVRLWRTFRRPPHRFKAGSWEMARLRGWDHLIILTWLTVAAFVRGMDYASGNDVWSSRDFMLSAAPAWVWGWAFMLGAMVLVWGTTTRRHFYVWMGHGWLFIAYGVNAFATAGAREDLWGVALLGTLLASCAAGFVYFRNRGWIKWLAGLLPIALWFFLIYVWPGTVPDLNGIRGAFALGAISLLHLLYHLRTGIVPLRVDDVSTKVATVGVSGGARE